jgi:hypothetical protein
MQAAECGGGGDAAVVAEQEYRPVTEDEEAESRLEERHRKWSGRIVVMSCVLPLILLAAWGREHRRGRTSRVPVKNRTRRRSTPCFSRRSTLSPEAQHVVRQFLGSRGRRNYWPLVAEEARVAGSHGMVLRTVSAAARSGKR